ncbi:MAG: carbohydrate ABC transporter permease [Candidatus Marinimicrobia bacterium]|nr:carbohydrate ABC transporter permease [Candidatus Neomarinimicrobiota bacterium]MCF7840797.1 carbohydrate ABC transporter permease [Candidatus Neomarinimicrobiota bacterium]
MQSTKKIILFILLLLVTIIFIYPFFWMIGGTLKPEAEVMQFSPFGSYWTLDSYRSMLDKIPLFKALLNSLLVSSISTASVLVLCSMMGYALARLRFKGRSLMTNIIIFTMVLPFQLTLIPLYVLMVKFGWVDSYVALILPYTMSAFAILLFRQFFQQIPQDLIDAARMDGLGDFGILFRIFWPLSKPALITVGIIHFMGMWNDALWPLIVVRKVELMTMPQMVALFAVGGQAESQVGSQLAAATLMSLPIIIVYLFMQRHFIESMASSGLKG